MMPNIDEHLRKAEKKLEEFFKKHFKCDVTVHITVSEKAVQ